MRRRFGEELRGREAYYIVGAWRFKGSTTLSQVRRCALPEELSHSARCQVVYYEHY